MPKVARKGKAVTRAESEVHRKTLIDAERQIAEGIAAVRRSCGDVPNLTAILPARFSEHIEVVDGEVRMLGRPKGGRRAVKP